VSKPRAGGAQEERRPGGIRRLRRWALLAVVALTPGTSTAQGQTFGTMAFSTTHTYDDNLFATPASRGRDGDFISRFGPTIEAGHRSLPLTLVGRYAVDAERYWHHAGLNRHVARQDGAVQVDYRSTRRLTLNGRASYVETQTPLEFNVNSRLALGRVHAERVTAGSANTYALDAATRLTLDYEFAREGLADQPYTIAHYPRTGIEWRADPRTTYRFDYRARRLGIRGGDVDVSHILAAGMARQLTRLMHVELEVGPRLSDGAIHPELSATLQGRVGPSVLSLGYADTEVRLLGEAGGIDMRRLSASVTYQPWRHVTLTAAPAFVRSTLGRRYATVRTVELEAAIRLTPELSLVTSSRAGRQEGNLSGSHEDIPYRSLGMTLRAALPAKGNRTREPRQ